MMWCGRMIYRASKRSQVLSEMETELYRRSTTHETIHLKQAQLYDTWLKYYWRYFLEWIKESHYTSCKRSVLHNPFRDGSIRQ